MEKFSDEEKLLFDYMKVYTKEKYKNYDIFIDKFLYYVSYIYDVEIDNIIGKERNEYFNYIRRIVIYILHKKYNVSFDRIKKLFDSDPHIILAMYDQAEEEIKTNNSFEKEIELLSKNLDYMGIELINITDVIKNFHLGEKFEVNTWFINVISKMLMILCDNKNSYPLRFHKEYYDVHKEELGKVDEFMFTQVFENNLSTELKHKQEEMKQYSSYKWNAILLKMIHLFNEAKCESLALKNDYQRKCAKEGLELFKEYFEDLWW